MILRPQILRKRRQNPRKGLEQGYQSLEVFSRKSQKKLSQEDTVSKEAYHLDDGDQVNQKERWTTWGMNRSTIYLNPIRI